MNRYAKREKLRQNRSASNKLEDVQRKTRRRATRGRHRCATRRDGAHAALLHAAALAPAALFSLIFFCLPCALPATAASAASAFNCNQLLPLWQTRWAEDSMKATAVNVGGGQKMAKSRNRRNNNNNNGSIMAKRNNRS